MALDHAPTLSRKPVTDHPYCASSDVTHCIETRKVDNLALISESSAMGLRLVGFLALAFCQNRALASSLSRYIRVEKHVLFCPESK